MESLILKLREKENTQGISVELVKEIYDSSDVGKSLEDVLEWILLNYIRKRKLSTLSHLQLQHGAVTKKSASLS
jgi:hypothetical protein